MGDIRSTYSDYERYYLKSDFADSIRIDEPQGWDDDDFQLDRHDTYHGMFTNLTSDLKFTGEAKEYIISAYAIGGINANCRLTKKVLRDIDGELKWVERYSVLADHQERVIKGDILTIKFNGNKLADILKSYETDAFEIERLDSIDGKNLVPFIKNKVNLKGRSIVDRGEATFNAPAEYLPQFSGLQVVTPLTTIISQGPDRHSLIYIGEYDDGELTEDHVIFAKTQDENLKPTEITLDYDINFHMDNVEVWWKLEIVHAKWNATYATFDEVDVDILATKTVGVDGITGMKGHFSYKGQYKATLEWNDILFIKWSFGDEHFRLRFLETDPRSFYEISSVEYYEESVGLDFAFVHDVVERLLYIITGEQDLLYSKYFGRDNHPRINYVENGFGGLIGMISGFWLRAFNPTSENYKSLTISLQDIFNDLMAVFNIGIGIESNVLSERVRIEDLKYFYQPEVVVKLPYPVGSNQSIEKMDPDLFFSGGSFGYEISGDYEDKNGLDEPNVNSNFVFPIKRTDNKYVQKSKTRADERGAELTRRKPEIFYADEDTPRDASNWFLDLKKTDGQNYEQVEWIDRLDEEPTDIHSPETWRSFLFTPLQMMFRHGWIFRAGMEPYLDKYIRHTYAKGNSNVSTQFIGKKKYSEETDVLTSDIDRSRFLPETDEIEHVVTDELMDLVLGTTKRTVNGEEEDIPNYYFKMEYVKDGEIRRGYLLNLKPKGKGKWIFQRANENLI